MDLETAHSVVLGTLERAASQNAEILKPAENKLKEWETEPGFYSILLNIFSNHAIDVNVRWLAVLYFKNGVDRYWRKTAPNAISEPEKATLRQGLITNFREPINQVATQISVLISKIARFDCPREWPELINTLLAAVKSEDALVQHRALLTLHHVIKTLSSKRLAGDRRLFQELTANVYGFVLNLWHSHVEAFLQATQSSQEPGPALEKALLSLRVLRKLTVHGFKKPHESQDVILFVSVIFERAKTMLELRKTLQNRGGSVTELCEKFIIHLTKVLMDILEHHPFSYINFIQPTLEFAIYFIFTPAGEPLLFERFVIQCMNLIKGILLCVEYKPAKIREETRDAATLQAHEIKTDFFTPATLTEVCRKLVSHYFLLTPDDLQLWDADPESFATDEGGESWKYSLRPCTETLFLSVFHEFRAMLSPVLLEMIRDNHQLVDPSDLSGIRRKDAVYNAVGLAAYDLYDDVDFDAWFTSNLIEELKMKDPNYRIIRRRVVWLLGQWSAVKFSTELRPLLYASILPLLQGDEDMAVRIAASNTLRLAIDDFEFNTEQFLPYLEPAFRLLFCLLKEVNECDTKMHVLHVSSFIVERVGLAIRPHAGSLIQYLPMLWQESAEHNMLRCAIVSTLVHLVQALGTDSVLSSFLLPVIGLSTDVHQDCHVYLLEDGLELWLAVLENSASLTPDLLMLFQNMPPLLEFTSENLRTCFYIIQAYILLSPEEFLKAFGSVVIAACNDMLSDMMSEGIVMTMRLVEMCLRALPGQMGAELVQPLLSRVLEAVFQGEEYPMVMSMYLSIVARVLLCSREAFGQALGRVAENVRNTQENVLGKVLDVWLDKMSLVTQPERRKLLGLALASMLTARSPSVLDRFCGILLNVAEVLNDIMKVDNAGVQLDSLMISADQQAPPVTSSGEESGGECETEHDVRRRQLASSDPVHTVVLRDFLQQQVLELQGQVGLPQFEQLLQTVDCETMEQVRDFIRI